MYQYKSININDLMLDVQNSRFGDNVDGQREAIKVMVENQGQKIVKLAKDIAENGVDPSERMIVVESDDEEKGFIVKEGNRRVTALKLIENPSLVQNKTLELTFEKIKKSRKIRVLNVDCVVYDNEEYNHWINLKHTGQNEGAGRVGWTTPEQLRYMARNGKESFANQLYSFIDLFPEHFENIIKNKSKVKITNLDRLIGDPSFRKSLNLNGVDGLLFCSQPLNRFISELKKILDVMILTDDNGRPEFTVNRIRSKDDRANFISELGLTSFSPALEKEWRLLEPPKSSSKDDGRQNEKGSQNDTNHEKNTAGDVDTGHEKSSGEHSTTGDGEGKNSGGSSDTDDKAKGKKGSNPAGVKRNHMIPMGVSLKFGTKHKRCHRIFTELKRMTHEDHQNSLAVMLRVFIELSLNTYIDINNLVYQDKKNPHKTPGLHDKVVMVSSNLFEKKIIDGPKKTAIQSYSKQMTSSSASLQQYVHNANLIPEKEFVNTEWDNFQPLIEAIWGSIAS
ncbi:hypothetical protein [Dickeya dianthicola]|uniref:hypothetical protein n=1 Tax=Dickeya dianthicola TaxID=204039 RepID=UPI0003A80DF5|nr:hypothetical protein [Dickeya dianthicola]MCI4190203.1 hypothetical protein [Dickeya dianthicola]MCI4198691.1 hypothetical protein [Dickeya dianthicola]MCI4207467.1 hypothetical protein [Dickeya dianthicola]MCI4229412.1 hypothetical protein [Dickeya dianthicola]MZG35470.1 hypothetical protein [Dickeya dianthicola]